MENKNRPAPKPYRVYKMDISYFSGKFEAYLRYKGIEHTAIETTRRDLDYIADATGVKKIPAVKTEDGQWLFDTTPMLQWFETQYPDAPIFPHDPALRFIALLLEDYGDEWLWRPAMWWRWIPRASRWALGWRIATTVFPAFVARPIGWYFGRRQLKEWLWNDGVTRDNVGDVRDMLFREFEFLEPLLEQQPFLLGSHPSAADFGYFASMFRHFGNDVESAEVMRRHAPNTYEWTARLWNAKPGKLQPQQTWVWPEAEYWSPLLRRLSQDYLPYLHQNALAYQNGQTEFNHQGNTFNFNGTKTTTYRVWCRERLQQEYAKLSDTDKTRLDDLFEPHGSLAALTQDGVIASGLEESLRLPIKASNAPHKQSLKVKLFGQPRN